MIQLVFDTEKAQTALRETNKQYRPLMQQAVAAFLERVRRDAGQKEIIPSKHPDITNPYMLSKKQPSTPGKLTSRTRKLVWALLQDVDERGKAGFTGGVRLKKQTAIFEEVISRSLKTDLESFVGSLKYSWKGHGRLTSSGEYTDDEKRMPLEGPAQFFFRLKWDTGMRGQKRGSITPAAEKGEHKYLQRIAESRMNEAIRAGGLQP